MPGNDSKELAENIRRKRELQLKGLRVAGGNLASPGEVGERLEDLKAIRGTATPEPMSQEAIAKRKTWGDPTDSMKAPGTDQIKPSPQKTREHKEEVDRKYDKGTDDGSFKINDIQFTIPPEQISIQKDIKNVSIPVLRASATQKVRTGHGFVQVNLPLTFTTLTDVNTKLIPLVYSLRRQPFLWVENKYLRKVLMPISWSDKHNEDTQALMFTLQAMSVQSVENLPTTVQCFLQLLWFNYLPYTNEIRFREKWDIPTREGSTRTGYREDTFRNKGRQESLTKMNNANLLSEKVKYYDELQDPVFRPEDSEAWLNFIKGSSVYNLTSNDWGPNVPTGRYFNLEYRRYYQGETPPEGYLLEDPNYGVWYKDHKFYSSDDFNPVHVSVGFQNRVAQLPLLEQQLPTHQFMGSSDRMVTITFFVTPKGQSQMTWFNKVIQDYENQVIMFRQYNKDMFMKMWNPITHMCGMGPVVPESIHTETVPGNPGSSMVRVTFSEYNPSSHPEPVDVEGKQDKILREFVVSCFNELGTAERVVDWWDNKSLVISGQNTELSAQPAEVNFPTPNVPEPERESNQLKQPEVITPWSQVNKPGRWLTMKIKEREVQARHTRQDYQEDKTDIWKFCNHICGITREYKAGFAYASDEQSFGLKSYVGLSLYQDPGVFSPDQIAREAANLSAKLEGYVRTNLLGALGASRFPKLVLDYKNSDIDTEPCYPDMELPDHPLDPGSSLHTEPDFYFYNPELVPALAAHTPAKKLGEYHRQLTERLLKENSETELNAGDNEKIKEDLKPKEYSNAAQPVDLSNLPGTKHLKGSSTIDTIAHFDSSKPDTLTLGPEGELYTITSENIYNTAVADVKKNRELSMRKAFPTFRLHFVREGTNKTTLRGFHQSYGGFAVNEIRFIASRKIATDTCVITLANLDGFIETDILNDIRPDSQQSRQSRLTTDNKNYLYEYDDLIATQIAIQKNPNDGFGVEVDDYTVRRIIEHVRNNPVPGGYGPMGLTYKTAYDATGKDLTPTQLAEPVTNIQIGIGVMARILVDLQRYQGDDRVSEVAAAIYLYPELQGEIQQAVDETADQGQITANWFRNIANQDVQSLVQNVRAQDTSEAAQQRFQLQQEEKDLKREQQQLELRLKGVDVSTVAPDVVDIGVSKGPEDRLGTVLSEEGSKHLLDSVLSEQGKKHVFTGGKTEEQLTRDRLNAVKARLAQVKRELDQNTFRPPGEGMIFREGTDVVLQLGYSNNPAKLEVVFVGHVTEAHPGPGTVTLICQTFATELVQQIKGVEEDMTLSESWILGGRDVDGPRIAEWILTQPEVKHFGRWENREESQELGRNVRGRSAWAWRIRNTVVDDNVYLREEKIFDWDSSHFTLNNRTLWHGLMDLSFRFPGFIVGVRPFKDKWWWRNTLFVGRPDFSYLKNTPVNISEIIEQVNTGVDPGFLPNDISASEIFDPVTQLPVIGLSSENNVWWGKFAQRGALKDLNTIIGDEQSALKVGEKDPGPVPRGQTEKERVAAELEELLSSRREPFRRYHVLTSYHDIIDNGIILTKRDIKNAVRLQGRGARQFYEKKLDFMDEQYRKWLEVRNDNAVGDSDVGHNMATSILMWHLRDIYDGEITILGDPTIRPYDVCYIYDNYNDFSGPVEVEQVVHTLSSETGFITQIVPDLYNTISDLPTRTNISAFGVYGYRWMLQHMGLMGANLKEEYERTPETWLRQQNQTGVSIGLERHGLDGDNWASAVGGAVLWTGVASFIGLWPLAGVPMFLGAYFLGGYLKDHATIRVVPLMHKGHPFVTGLQGFQAPETMDIMLAQYQAWRKAVSKKWKATSELARAAINPISRDAVVDRVVDTIIPSPILP